MDWNKLTSRWLVGVLLIAQIVVAAPVTSQAPALPQPPAESVYQISPWQDGSLIAAGSLATLLPFVFSSQLITPHPPHGREEVNAFDRPVVGNHSDFANTVSDVGVALALTLPVVGDAADLGFGNVFLEDVVVYAETLAVSGALVTATKFTVQRPLPRLYEGGDPRENSPKGYVSFYSGHTSTTMAALSAAAVTLSLRYHTGWWPWAVAGVAGLGVGTAKILAGEHFYSDVAVGFVVGTAVGTLIPWLHRRHPAGGNLVLAPMANGVRLQFFKTF